MKGLSEFHFQSIGKLTRLVAMTKPSRILQSMPNVITLIDIITYDICIYQIDYRNSSTIETRRHAFTKNMEILLFLVLT